jgi:hypothetical protein
MVDELEILSRLSAAAGGQGPPRLDVSKRVLVEIAARPQRPSPAMAACAVLSVAAAVVCILAAQAASVAADPLGDMLNGMAQVMP